jgi:hypothetical protein
LANRTTYPMRTPKSDVEYLTMKFVGGGAGQPTLPEATQYGGGELSGVTWSATGQYACVLRRKYAALKSADAYIVGATAGLQARITAVDVGAGTLSIQTEVGAVATNAATTDTIYVTLVVRNSGRNA